MAELIEANTGANAAGKEQRLLDVLARFDGEPAERSGGR